MSAFGGLITTNIGRNLQAKAQLGTPLQFTRMGLGDGELGGSPIVDLTALKHEVKSLNLAQFQLLTGGKAKIRAVLSNQDVVSGFYWREIGVFAQDPDLGEILYCYGNAGALAEYIPAGGGADVIEKVINIITLIGNASSVSAVLDQSLVWATQQEFEDHITNADAHPQYAKITDLAAGIGGHEQATNPHPQYATGVALATHSAETATETLAGHVELATATETTAGTDNTRAVHPAGLKVELDKKIAKNLLSAKGDIIYASAANTPARLAIGAAGQYLKVKSDGTVEWGELDVIQPTKPKAVDFGTTSAAASTWYTVINVTSGKGILSRLSYKTITIPIDKVTLRLTIDGTVQTITLLGNAARGFGEESSGTSFDYVFHTFFTASMKIEVMHTDTAAGSMWAVVDYNLV